MKLVNYTAAFFTRLYSKYEAKPLVIKLTELYIKIERKSLFSRCLALSALAHAFILFPGAFLSEDKFVDEKPIGIEVSLGSDFGGIPELMPLDEIDSKPEENTLEQKAVPQTALKNDAPKAEFKAGDATKTKSKKSIETASAKPGGGNESQGVAPEDYLELLQYTVEDLSEVPDGGEHLTGTAVLRLEFNRQGYVTRYILKKPTGQPTLDAAANDVAHRLMSQPFPPAPDGFDKGEKLLRYDFLIKYPPKPRVIGRL